MWLLFFDPPLFFDFDLVFVLGFDGLAGLVVGGGGAGWSWLTEPWR